MGFVIYACDDGFPERSQAILRNSGYLVEPLPGRLGKIADLPRGFGFSVSKRKVVLDIAGYEDNGLLGFTITWPAGWNPFTWWGASRLHHEVEAILLNNGARKLTTDELRAEHPPERHK